MKILSNPSQLHKINENVIDFSAIRAPESMLIYPIDTVCPKILQYWQMWVWVKKSKNVIVYDSQ
jgi:hypothetical protein